MAKESYVIGFQVDKVTELALKMKGQQQEFYRRLDASSLPQEAVEMLEAFDFASMGKHHFTPMVVDEFDHHPVTDEELVAAILAGRLGITQEADGSFKELLKRFLARKASFAELREAVGATPQ